MARKVAAKRSAAKQKMPYDAMVRQAIAALGDKNGSSAQQIARYIARNFKVGSAHAANMKMALRRAVRAGRVVQSNGRFRLKVTGGAKPAAAKKRTLKKRATRPKKTSVKKMKRSARKSRSAARKARKAVSKKRRTTRKVKKIARKPAARKPVAVKSMPRRSSKRSAARRARAAMRSCY
ncbi:histone H1-delta-like [Rhopilema esculentum]|uniref:histone H1-delta-like n=1 Tax=Rhopilema esculentum TaxID=499914 RepID=UPI0031DEC77D|eukprot:gene5881-11211_t